MTVGSVMGPLQCVAASVQQEPSLSQSARGLQASKFGPASNLTNGLVADAIATMQVVVRPLMAS